MRALTIRQPWASAIVAGHKRIETRSWRTHYRGELLIHAAAGVGDIELGRDLARVGALDRDLPHGAIIGRCRLTDVRRVETMTGLDELERYLGDYSPGRFGWVLDDIEAIAPTPAKGALGIWTYRQL